jgi:hypothetical protein
VPALLAPFRKGVTLAFHSMMPAGASCNQSASTRQSCTSAERAVDRRASTQLLAPRHAMWTQAPRFESIPAWAPKSTRPRIFLTDGPKTNAYRALVNPRDWTCGFISRADVADFLVKQIDDDAFLHKTPVLTSFLRTSSSEPPSSVMIVAARQRNGRRPAPQ